MSRTKLLAVLASLALAVGAILALVTPGTAFAGTGNQWCDGLGVCPNAWNGGPAVASYGYSTQNNDFTLIRDVNECNGGTTTSTCPGHNIPAGMPVVMVEYTGNHGEVGTCMEDYDNNLGNAKDGIGGSCSGTGGWGANFVQYNNPSGPCPGDISLWNIHWVGYLTFSDTTGSQVYLNGGTGNCLRALPPA